jgi:hypothetical protein
METISDILAKIDTDTLRAELKRRTVLQQQEREKEYKEAKRCRNCIHFKNLDNFPNLYICEARTWGKRYKRHYSVVKSQKACDLFKNKNDEK